jgi:hypothetical protein
MAQLRIGPTVRIKEENEMGPIRRIKRKIDFGPTQLSPTVK